MSKISMKDILKMGADLTPHTLEDKEETKKLILDCLRQQQEILNAAKIDWNDPITREQLHRPMDI